MGFPEPYATILQVIGVLTIFGVGCLLWLAYAPTPKRTPAEIARERSAGEEALQRGLTDRAHVDSLAHNPIYVNEVTDLIQCGVPFPDQLAIANRFLDWHYTHGGKR